MSSICVFTLITLLCCLLTARLPLEWRGMSQPIRPRQEAVMSISRPIRRKEQPDGSLTVEVIVCHPDWEEAKTVASIHSRPQDDGTATPSLKCDLQVSGPDELQRASGA